MSGIPPANMNVAFDKVVLLTLIFNWAGLLKSSFVKTAGRSSVIFLYLNQVTKSHVTRAVSLSVPVEET